MYPSSMALLDDNVGVDPKGIDDRGLVTTAYQNTDDMTRKPSLGIRPPPPLKFHTLTRPGPPPLSQIHPVFDTPADRDMTRAIRDATKRPNEAASVKILGGLKNGFKVQLSGPSGQDSNASIQDPGGHNYVITPAGAAKGENISINGGGLYLRSQFCNSSRILVYSFRQCS